MASLQLRNVVKRYGTTTVIPGIDLDIEDGEFVVFVGPSGCGKSTLLRMISGLEEVTDGDLTIDGRRVNDVSAAQRGLAMVFQSYALYPHMTVYQNLAFGLENLRMPRAEIETKVGEAARMLKLDALLERRPTQLSGGQRQRVAIGRAIVRNPTIFLFDEPLSNLDAELRVQMRSEITGLHDRLKTTMIYVTHDQVEAMTMADKIVVLRSGRIEQVGAPLDLYNCPHNRFVAGFIGSPQMNFLKARITSVGAGGIGGRAGGRSRRHRHRPAARCRCRGCRSSRSCWAFGRNTSSPELPASRRSHCMRDSTVANSWAPRRSSIARSPMVSTWRSTYRVNWKRGPATRSP